MGNELGKMKEEDGMGRKSKFLQSRNLEVSFFIFFSCLFLFYLGLGFSKR